MTTEAVGELYTLLARCFDSPNDELLDALQDGSLHDQLVERSERLGFSPERPPTPAVDTAGEFRERYLSTFEAFDGPYAAPAQSAYEQWWDGRQGGLLGGPAATDMRERYDRAGIDVPDAYPPDHVAVVLEYAGLLLESGQMQAYADFHADHMGWFSAFQRQIEETEGAEFYQWAASVLVETVEQVETAFELTERQVTEP
ncbi:MAG: molecular chaperone TorD family protein [Halovenus sp.]